MKCVPRSRNLVATVVVFLLAASAPAALALPAGPGGGGGGGITWDVTAFFDWMQDVFGGFFGGGVGEDDGLGVITGKARSELDPNGNDLKTAYTGDTSGTSTLTQDPALNR